MKRRIFIIAIAFVILLSGSVWMYNRNNFSFYHSKGREAKEILKLNPLAVSASEESVASIDIPDSQTDIFGEDVVAYKVEGHKYTKKQIDTIVEKLDLGVYAKQKLEDTVDVYQFKDGGYMEYYEESGAISYTSETDSEKDMDELEKSLDKKRCRKVADSFITETEIIDKKELEYVSTDVCQTIETVKGEEILTYEVYYRKKHPEGDMEYYGVGPGIRIEIDKDYNIRSFISIDKDVKKITGTYATIDEDEVIDKIYNKDGVQIDGSSEGKRNVKINRVNCYLYCDPIAQKQTYMAPYYVMDGKDDKGQEVTITVPAIDDSKIEYVK